MIIKGKVAINSFFLDQFTSVDVLTHQKDGVVYLASREIGGWWWEGSRRENTPDIVPVYFCRGQHVVRSSLSARHHENLTMVQLEIYLNENWSKTYIVARVRGVEGTGVKSPCDVEVGQVVGPAGSGVAGHFTGGLPSRSSPYLSSSEDITLT